jgi:hypothetical protein
VLELGQRPSKQLDVRNHLAAAQRNAFDNLNQLREMLGAFEQVHNIPEHWTPNTEQWRRAAQYLSVRKYQVALDKLEGLVVQRLFELAKMGLSGTGKNFFLVS